MTKYDEDGTIRIDNEDGIITIVCEGAFDFVNAGKLREALMESVATGSGVVVDFIGATYIDTAVLAYLAKAANQMLARGQRLQVKIAEPTHPHRALQLTGFSTVVDMLVSPKV